MDSKMILMDAGNGLYWIPENYRSLDLEITSGIPEPVIKLTEEDIATIFSNSYEKLAKVSLTQQAIPGREFVKSVILFNLNKVLREKY